MVKFDAKSICSVEHPDQQQTHSFRVETIFHQASASDRIFTLAILSPNVNAQSSSETKSWDAGGPPPTHTQRLAQRVRRHPTALPFQGIGVFGMYDQTTYII